MPWYAPMVCELAHRKLRDIEVRKSVKNLSDEPRYHSLSLDTYRGILPESRLIGGYRWVQSASICLDLPRRDSHWGWSREVHSCSTNTEVLQILHKSKSSLIFSSNLGSSWFVIHQVGTCAAVHITSRFKLVVSSASGGKCVILVIKRIFMFIQHWCRLNVRI